MRWHGEVTSMDSADVQSVVVEAESWQKALHAARVARGEAGPISGFSIELLDDAYRAVDPLARRRYDVKRAADGTPITAQAAAASVPPAPVPTAAPASGTTSTPAARPPPAAPPPPPAVVTIAAASPAAAPEVPRPGP